MAEGEQIVLEVESNPAELSLKDIAQDICSRLGTEIGDWLRGSAQFGKVSYVADGIVLNSIVEVSREMVFRVLETINRNNFDGGGSGVFLKMGDVVAQESDSVSVADSWSALRGDVAAHAENALLVDEFGDFDKEDSVEEWLTSVADSVASALDFVDPCVFFMKKTEKRLGK